MNTMNGPKNDRILIVDDDASVHGAIRLALEGLSSGSAPENPALLASSPNSAAPPRNPRRTFVIDSAYGGEEALKKASEAGAENKPYAMAFVDRRMPPGWDGVETITRLWEKFPDLQVVLCTAHCDYHWEAVAERLGDTDRLVMLRKPFGREEILQLAHMLTRKWERERCQQTPPPLSVDETFQLLILEDDPLTSRFLQEKLAAGFPDIKILHAGTIAEANLLQAGNPVDLFLLDMFVPDGSGIDFLFQVMTAQPTARAVMMTGQVHGEYRSLAEQSGVLNFLEKPVNIPELSDIIRRQVEAKRSELQGLSCFAATLTRLTTIDIVQLKCLSQATATLEFVRRDGVRGHVWFERGEIVHAEAPGLKGENAFTTIIGWRNGRAQEVMLPPPRERSITASWQSLLLHTAQQLDEGASPEPLPLTA